jgi:endonuclease YncB( thermonuclease family)
MMGRVLASLIILCSLLPVMGVCADIAGPAFVQDDGSLVVDRRKIHLFGIYIPPTDRDCHIFVQPVRCSSRAALALDLKIQGFVHCQAKSKNPDGSINAVCAVNKNFSSEGEDLSAYLLRQGWAAARPGAPFEYHVLENIARRKSLGVWGFAADSIQ